MDTGNLGFKSMPAVAGSFSGSILVCATGRSMWADLEAAMLLRPNAHVMAVKQAGIHLPMRFQHWAGAHGERFQWMVPLCADGYYFRGGEAKGIRGVFPQKRSDLLIHSDKPWPMVDHVWPIPLKGTSGLFAIKVALGLGYGEVTLCGMPLDNSGRYYSAPGGGVSLGNIDMEEWERMLPIFAGRVKSMSGRTRELLGGI